MRKKLIYNHYILDKVLDKNKETWGIVQFHYTKILSDTDNKLPDYIILKNAMILIICIIKYDGKFYTKIFLEEVLYDK